MKKLKLIPDNTNIKFAEKRVICVSLSVLFIVLSIVLYFTRGLNYGIDFEGGTWHSFHALEKDTVLFEVKPGPYNPDADKEFAPWALWVRTDGFVPQITPGEEMFREDETKLDYEGIEISPATGDLVVRERQSPMSSVIVPPDSRMILGFFVNLDKKGEFACPIWIEESEGAQIGCVFRIKPTDLETEY